MTKTTNYQLNQWDPDDPVRRTDFNEDNAKTEAALNQLAALSAQRGHVCGTYTGNAVTGRQIELGFEAAFVMIFCQSGPASESYDYYIEHGFITPAGLLYRGSHDGSMSIHEATRCTGTKLVLGTVNYMNRSGRTYFYIAFRK